LGKKLLPEEGQKGRGGFTLNYYYLIPLLGLIGIILPSIIYLPLFGPWRDYLVNPWGGKLGPKPGIFGGLRIIPLKLFPPFWWPTLLALILICLGPSALLI